MGKFKKARRSEGREGREARGDEQGARREGGEGQMDDLAKKKKKR